MKTVEVDVIKTCTIAGKKRKAGDTSVPCNDRDAKRLADEGYVKPHEPKASKPISTPKTDSAGSAG